MMNRYPSVSPTFIQPEIDAVRAAGVEVVPVALAPAAATDVLCEADRRARKETATIRPVSVLLLWQAVVVPLLRYPGAFVATLFQGLRAARTDVRDGLWSVFYFVEALILWQHCERNRVRHLNAHFASARATSHGWPSFGNQRRRGEPPWSWSMTVHGWHEFVDERKHSLGEKAAAADKP
jgi:hypothetical protein